MVYSKWLRITCNIISSVKNTPHILPCDVGVSREIANAGCRILIDWLDDSSPCIHP